jgi:hypothetical protein
LTDKKWTLTDTFNGLPGLIRLVERAYRTLEA